MKTLIIYELVPDATKLYLLSGAETANQNVLDNLELVHNSYIGVEESGTSQKLRDAQDWLAAFLADKTPLQLNNGKPLMFDRGLRVILTGALL